MNMSSSPPFVVHKFGGTSVGDASCFLQVQKIMQKELQSKKIAIVVSGMGGKPKVTDLLLRSIEYAQQDRKKELNDILTLLIHKHQTAIQTLLKDDPDAAQSIMNQFLKDIDQLREVLRAISIMRFSNERVVELISGHGELWSARILTALLNKDIPDPKDHFAFLDARKVLIVEQDEDQGPSVLYEETAKRLKPFLDKGIERFVITGFIASTIDQVTTTLKRDGSDFSASIFGKLLGASKITIWTDVNGVFSADPRRVPEALALDRVSYKEAMELAYFGAKVIHPKTMTPAVDKSIPIYIRNTFNPQHPGTCIFQSLVGPEAADEQLVRGFSTVDKLALFNLEGSGMVGVYGLASRLFGALEKAKVNIVLIAQASSEHSICFAVPEESAEIAKQSILDAFFREIHHGHIDTIDFISPVSIIAAVGDSMSQTPGVCARFFGALRKSKINVLAISQGSSERNISAVVRSSDSAPALRAVHSAFFLSEQALSVGIIMHGNALRRKNRILNPTSDEEEWETYRKDEEVAYELLRQLYQQTDYLMSRYFVDIRVRGICDAKRMILHSNGIDLKAFSKNPSMIENMEIFDVDKFTDHIRADHFPHWLMLDLSSSSSLVDSYTDWLSSKVNVISANRGAASCPSEKFRLIDEARCRGNALYSIEPCLSIGLPVLRVLHNFHQTGDQILKVEASLSTAMGWILNRLKNSENLLFSEAVKQRFEHEEEDEDEYANMTTLLEDIVGITSARKLLILARQMGLDIELKSISIDNPIEEPRKPIHRVDDLVHYLQQFDGAMQELVDTARKTNKLLCLMSTIDTEESSIQVKLCAIPNHHPFASFHGLVSGISFYTHHYEHQPLCISGPCPTSSILAHGIFGNILELARGIGARDHGTNGSSSNPLAIE